MSWRASARTLLAAVVAVIVAVIPASAQDTPPDAPLVAIIPLDGAPGTSSRDMRVVVRGLAEALIEDGRVQVVSGDDLVERLTEGKAQTLQEARDAFAEGQLLMREGDPDIGLAFLAESVAAHGRAGSPVVRREEMADAAFILAKALLAVEDHEAARNALVQALRLLPDYLDTQTEAADPALRELALEIEAELSRRPPRRLSAAGADALAGDIQVDEVIHGVVLADGTVLLTVYRNGEAVHELRRPGPFRARRLEDPWYDQVARPLADAALGLEPRDLDPTVVTEAPDPTPDPVDPDPVDPDPVAPDPAPRGKGARIGLAIAAVAVVGAAATGGTLYTLDRRGEPQDAWDLQIVLMQ